MIGIPLAILAFKKALDSTYASKLNDQEKVLLESFLLVLKIRGFFRQVEKTSNGDHRNEIFRFLQVSKNPRLKRIGEDFLSPVLKKVRKPYFTALFGHYSELHTKVDYPLPEYFDKQLSSYFNQQGKLTGDAMQPKELTRLINHFMPRRKEFTYYNPFGGLASLALDVPKEAIYKGEELDQLTWILAELRLLAHNCPAHFSYENADSLEEVGEPKTERFDFIAFNPPFNLKPDFKVPFGVNRAFIHSRNSISLIVSSIILKLKDDGKLVFVTPNSFLYSSHPVDQEFKKSLIENNHLEAVISLPNRILNFTSLPISLIVLNKDRQNNNIKFLDATTFFKGSSKIRSIDVKRVLDFLEEEEESQYFQYANREEVISFDYNFGVNRYVYEKPDFTSVEKEILVPLRDLVQVKRIRNQKDVEGRIITLKDLSVDSAELEINPSFLQRRGVNRNYGVLDKRAMVLSLLGNDLRATIVNPKSEKIFYPVHQFLAIEANEQKVETEYLLLELHKDYVKKQLKPIQVESQISRIPPRNLLDIQIIVPSLLAQQTKIGREYFVVKQDKLFEARKESDEKKIEVSEENSFLRHEISGTLSNARRNFKFIKKILDEKGVPGLPELYSLTPDQKIKTSLLDYLNRMERDLNSISKAVERAGVEIDLAEINSEKIDLIHFVEEYVQELRDSNGGRYEVKVNKDIDTLRQNQVESIYVLGDRDLLRKMMNNIIENADKHGFEKKINPSNRIQSDFLYDFEDQSVQLDVSNTGEPLPENFSFDAYVRKGSSMGKNAGEGTGGWYIKKAMELHNGSLSITDETGSEGVGGDLVTSIELIFPLQIN